MVHKLQHDRINYLKLDINFCFIDLLLLHFPFKLDSSRTSCGIESKYLYYYWNKSLQVLHM